jgi:peroxiredoxin
MEFPNLMNVHLSGDHLTDDDMHRLAGHPSLMSVGIDNARRITDDGFLYLAESENLTFIHANDARVSDVTLEALAESGKLSGVGLRGGAFTDAGVASLADTKTLTSLQVGGGANALTDSGLASLHGLKSLNMLSIRSTDISEEAMGVFREQVPDIRHIAGATTVSQSRAPMKPESTPPAFDVTTLDGEQVSLASLKGKVVVLNFWFIGSPPCRIEIPGLNKLVEEYADNEVVFLALANDAPKALNSFLGKTRFDYTIVPEAKDIAKQYNVSGFPTHVIIGRDGLVTQSLVGGSPSRHLDLVPIIDEALGESQTAEGQGAGAQGS